MSIITGLVLFLVRIVLTITFMNEANHKFKDIRGFAKNDGLPVPVAMFVATAELCAAISMITGVLAWWAGVGIMVLMVCTILLHVLKWHSPYWASKRGWEYDLLMFTLAAVVVTVGPGLFVLW